MTRLATRVAFFAVALELFFGALSPNVMAELPLSPDAGHTGGGTSLDAGVLLIIKAVDSGARSGKLLVNSGGTGLGGHATTVSSQTAALTMDANDMTAGTSHGLLNTSGGITIGHGAVPSSFGALTPVPTNIFYPTEPSGKAAELRVNDTNGDIGFIEDGLAFAAVPEPSTWYGAAFAAAVLCFQCCRQSRQNAWQIPWLPLALSKSRNRRALGRARPSFDFKGIRPRHI